MTTELDQFALSNKNIIVTGAAQGIGRSIAEAVVSLGGRAIVVDMQAAPLEELASLHSDRMLAIVGDVSDPDFAGQVVEKSVDRYGSLDGLVNNAGIIRPALIEKMKPHQWQQVIAVNLTGCFNFLQAVGRYMIERRKGEPNFSGALVNISSDAGRRGTIGQINYGAAKSGVLGLTMSAAREWSRHAIRVNSVCFGVVETPMTETVRSEKFRDAYLNQIPFGRWATPQEVARPVCFLLGNASSYITGQHLSVNGGFHIGF